MGVALSEMEPVRLSFCSLKFALLFREKRSRKGLLGWSNSVRALQRGLSLFTKQNKGRFAAAIGAVKRRDKALPPVKRLNGSARY
jgi:hypothetical protein